MQEKRVNSILEVDFSKVALPFPSIAVYRHPDDFPDKCVARVFDLDIPTDIIMVKGTVEEIQMDIQKHTTMKFFKRDEKDVPALIGTWI